MSSLAVFLLGPAESAIRTKKSGLPFTCRCHWNPRVAEENRSRKRMTLCLLHLLCAGFGERRLMYGYGRCRANALVSVADENLTGLEHDLSYLTGSTVCSSLIQHHLQGPTESCVAEIRVANKLHRSSVETIAVCMLLAPTYDLHVAQFYESVVR